MFGPRLRELRTRMGMTQEDLAQRSGLRAGTISEIERGDRAHRPQRGTMHLLAQGLGMAFGDFQNFILLGQPYTTEIRPPRPVTSSGVGIPILARVPATYGSPAENPDYPQSDQWSDTWIDRGDLADPEAFALVVRGDSMEPLLRDGDVVVCSPAASSSREDGRIYVLQLSGDADHDNFVRQVFFAGDHMMIHPVNDRYSPKRIPASHVLRCIRVVEVRRKV